MLKLFGGMAGLPLLVGCSVQVVDESEGASVDPITDVSHSPVKQQSIGNCWAYASAAWAESLVLRGTKETFNVSESYLSYWHWFEQIANPPPKKDGTAAPLAAVETAGGFGVAADIMLRYGIVSEGDFIPEEIESNASERQKTALEAMNRSLKSGALSTLSAQKDRALVRSELNKAFRLGPKVVTLLDTSFGKDVSTTLDRSFGTSQGPIRKASTFAIGANYNSKGPKKSLTLADAIGTRPTKWQFIDKRDGEFAWSEFKFQYTREEQRPLLQRVQKALHRGLPVMISWYVDFNALNEKGQFVLPPKTPGYQGGHLTVLEDYEVKNVPGFGILPVGKLETRPSALAAALDPAAEISFFRVKNSWGTSRPDRAFAPGMPGYHDVYMTYLAGMVQKCKPKADGMPNAADCFDDQALGEIILPNGLE